MRKIDFQRISETIQNRFPNEAASTFYIKTNKKRGQGKLYDQYQHIRSLLLEVGLADNLRQAAPNRSLDEGEEEIEEADEVAPKEESTEVALTFLETHAGPWDEVVAAWKKTFTRRQTESDSLIEYILKYPALQSNRGLELVSTGKSNEIIDKNLIFKHFS